MSAFPSLDHYEQLRLQFKAAGYKFDAAFVEFERHWMIAYDCAWRRHTLNDRSDQSPLDPGRKWYIRLMVDQAEQIFREPPGHEQMIRAADTEPDPQLRQIYEEQDRERTLLGRMVLTERWPDGKPTPEAVAYVECCTRQFKANCARIKRMPTVPGDNEELKRELGIRAVPEEPDELDDEISDGFAGNWHDTL